MAKRKPANMKTKPVTRALFFAAAIFYLSFHTLHGERGIYALIKETHRLEHLEKELSQVSAARSKLENKVNRFRNASLDRDLLDEQSRRMLGTMGKNEVIFLLPEKRS